MWYLFRQCRYGGAAVEYALFLSMVAILLVSGVAVVGNHFRPQLVAWQQGTQVDNTLTGTIRTEEKNEGNIKTYRILKLPSGLQQKQ